MTKFIAEISSVIIAAITSLVVVINLQRQGRVKHRFRVQLGVMIAVLAISLIVSRFILGRLDGATLIVDLPVIVVGAVLFRTGIYTGKEKPDSDMAE